MHNYSYWFYLLLGCWTGKLLKAKQTEGSVEINMLCRILDRTLRNFRTYKKLDINSLKDVAAIRAAFSELPAYFNEDISENVKSNAELRKCIQAAKHLCENESSLQLFLLKQLVHNDENGFDGVKERCKIKELKWILPPQSEVTNCSLTKLVYTYLFGLFYSWNELYYWRCQIFYLHIQISDLSYDMLR